MQLISKKAPESCAREQTGNEQPRRNRAAIGDHGNPNVEKEKGKQGESAKGVFAKMEKKPDRIARLREYKRSQFIIFSFFASKTN